MSECGQPPDRAIGESQDQLAGPDGTACWDCPPPAAKADNARTVTLRSPASPRAPPDGCGQRRAPRTPFSGVVPMSGGSALRVLGSAGVDLDRALQDEWAIWQHARNVSDNTIIERVLVIRRLPAAATVSTRW